MTTFTLQNFIDHDSYRWANGLTVGYDLINDTKTELQTLLFDFYYDGKSIGEIEVPLPDQPWFVECYQGAGYPILVLRIDDGDNLFIPLPDCSGPFTWQFIDLP